MWRFLALGGVGGHFAKNNALKRKYESRFDFSPPPPPNRWRVSPAAWVSAFSGVGVVFVWESANFGDIHLTFSGVSRLTFA